MRKSTTIPESGVLKHLKSFCGKYTNLQREIKEGVEKAEEELELEVRSRKLAKQTQMDLLEEQESARVERKRAAPRVPITSVGVETPEGI